MVDNDSGFRMIWSDWSQRDAVTHAIWDNIIYLNDDELQLHIESVRNEMLFVRPPSPTNVISHASDFLL